MSVYKVVSNLKHDGAFFKAGEKIDLDDEVAKNLLEEGVLDLVDEEAEYNARPMTAEEKKATQEVGEPEEGTGHEPVESEPLNDYTTMTKKELMDVAKEKGVKVPRGATNEAIIALLEGSDKSTSDEL